MKKFLIIIFLLTVRGASAQNIGLWTGASVEKKFNKSFSLNLNGQLRFTDQISTLKTYLGEAGVEYKLNKYFGGSIYYRYIGRRKYDKDTYDYYYRPYHRFYANLTFDYKLTKWLKFDYRLRYQNQFKDDESGLVNNGSYLRHKVEFAYKNKSIFSPYVSVDVFYLLGTGFDQIRCKTGVNTSLTKKHGVDLSVFVDRAVVGEQANSPVTTLTYKFKF
jgi:hypothetical protein